MSDPASLLRSIRIWLFVFIIGLILSGVTAFPLQTETGWLVAAAGSIHLASAFPDLAAWILQVHQSLWATGQQYPFLAYGTDWLAFAHLVIAVAFFGPWRDPVRNRWVIDFGLVACVGVLPLAFIAGPIRGIPLYWRCLDAAFGLLGAIPLLIARRRVDSLERLKLPA